MNNLPKLFVSIGDLEISLIVGCNNDENSFELLEKLTLPIESVSENRIADLDKITNVIKKNIFIIEQKVNYSFRSSSQAAASNCLILTTFEFNFSGKLTSFFFFLIEESNQSISIDSKRFIFS